MSNIAINKLTNANVYLNGTSFMGRAEEVDIPEVNYTFADHKGLGMFGMTELPSGLDKMEARIKWNAPYPDAIQQLSNATEAKQLTIRGNLESWASGGRTGQVPYVCTMTVLPKNIPGAKFVQQSNVEMESRLTVTRVKLVIDGQTQYEVDVMANILTIAGVDVLAQYRQNL
jgi:P2 family phage contractile tail tube protein